VKKMNWLGDLVQIETNENDYVLDLGCGIMQATLDHIPNYPKTRLQCAKITGVDIHKPYLDWLNKHYPEIETIHWDLKRTQLPFQDKSYDIILLIDILEHLDNLEYVENIISESNRIARNKIIILTPKKFDSNVISVQNAWGLGPNEYQKHRSFIKKKDLKNWGFKVIIPKQNRKQYYAVKKLGDSI